MITYTNFFKFVASIVTTSFFGLTFLSQSLYAQDNSTNRSSIFNWYNLWDTGSTQTTRTFSDVHGSGVDVTVEYSTNQQWQQSNPNSLNLYDN